MADDNYSILPTRKTPPTNDEISIDDVCESVDSGDIILFSDRSRNAFFVTTFCASRWSHVGIIYRESGKDPCILEAVKDQGHDIDVRKNAPQAGVRLIDLKTHLRNFSGYSVAIRFLGSKEELDIRSQLRALMTEQIGKFIELYHAKPYQDKYLLFVIARFGIFQQNFETVSAFFCSELVAMCYVMAGLLDTHSSCSFLPDSFSQTNEFIFQYSNQLPFRTLFPMKGCIQFSREFYVNTKMDSVI